MKLKSIKEFLDCRRSIIRIEIGRFLLNQSSEKIADDIFNRLWIESDVMLNKEINKLKELLTDDVSDWEIIDQVTELVTDKVTIKSIICPDEDIIPVDEIADYIKQDIEEKLPA